MYLISACMPWLGSSRLHDLIRYINFMKKTVFKENNDRLNIHECMYCRLFPNRCNGPNGYSMFIQGFSIQSCH